MKLPNDCTNDIYLKRAYAIGRGQTSFENDDDDDRSLRVAGLLTFSTDQSKMFSLDVIEPESVVCAFSMFGHSIGLGDSGLLIERQMFIF